MQAVQINRYGDSGVIQVNEIDKPVPKAGQVLVEVHAAAINPFDWKIRRGYMKEMIPLQFPITIGADFSGVISEIGEGVTDFAVGDEVYGSAIVLGGGSGAIAQYAAANTKSIAQKPGKLSHSEAAGLVLVGVSAVQALGEHIGLKPGEKILIHGGAGGIGSAAIQYAKHLEAYVATTVRGADKNFAIELGADEVIDYETEQFEEKLADYDAVFDTVGGDPYKRSFQIVKDGGVIVSMVEAPNEELVSGRGVKVVSQQTHTDRESLRHLAELADSGIIKAHIDKEYSLHETAEAFEYAEKGHPRGKVVIHTKDY